MPEEKRTAFIGPTVGWLTLDEAGNVNIVDKVTLEVAYDPDDPMQMFYKAVGAVMKQSPYQGPQTEEFHLRLLQEFAKSRG